MKIYLIISAVVLAALGWHSYTAKQLKVTRAALSTAEATIAAKDIQLDIERADRRRSDEAVTELQNRRDARADEPAIAGVRCRSIGYVPAQGRAAGRTDARPAQPVEGLPARDPRGDESDRPEIDVSAGLDWYAEACGQVVDTLTTLQAWETARTH